MKQKLTLAALIVFGCLPSDAATYYADPSVSGTSGSGTSGSPWCITNAVRLLSGGDTLIAKTGTYTLPLLITQSGSSGSMITIQGEDGAIIDPSYSLDSGWTLATEYSGGANGVYKHTDPGFLVGGLSCSNRNVEGFFWKDALKTSYYYINFADNKTEIGDSNFSTTLTDNSWWEGIEAMYYQTNGADLYLRFWGGMNPNGKGIRLYRRNNFNGDSATDVRDTLGAAVYFYGASYVTFRGFTVRGARFGIALENIGAVGSHHNVIESNTVNYGVDGILLRASYSDPNTGHLYSVSNNVIRYNVISENRWTTNTTRPFYGPWNGTDTNSWKYFNAYRFNKNYHADTFEGCGVYLYTSGGEVYGNTITNNPLGVATCSINWNPTLAPTTTIQSNVICSTSGSATFIALGAATVTVSDNLYTNVHYRLRMQEVNTATSFTRTLYDYRNRGWNPNGRGEWIYFHRASTDTGGSPFLWHYHNSWSGGNRSVYGSYGIGVTDGGMPNFVFLNNFWSAYDAVRDDYGTSFSGANFGIFDHNVLRTKNGSPGWWGATNAVTGTYQFATNSLPDFVLADTSPAYGYGVRLDQTFNIEGTNYSALPGTTGIYGNGMANSGWYQFETPGTPDNPPEPQFQIKQRTTRLKLR